MSISKKQYSRVTKNSLSEMKRNGEKIAMLTAYDFTLAGIIDRAGIDIILVGEMRDLETTSLAISAAETGHLVLSTLHTVNASQTVERIVDMYPANQQSQVRSMVANTLKAVISQTLLPKIGGGMVPAVEILLCDPAVRNIIREARTFEIANVIETNSLKGMISRDASIATLVFNGLVEKDIAIANSTDPQRLQMTLAA